MDTSAFFFLFAALWVIFAYVRIPLRVKKTLWVDPKAMPLSDPPAMEDWPDVAQLIEVGEQLVPLGYQKEELVVFSEMTPNSMIFLQPLGNAGELCVVTFTIAFRKMMGTWKVGASKIDFQTSFSDETSITTAFSRNLDLIKPAEGSQEFLVTWTNDPVELLSIHNRLIDHLAVHQVKVDVVKKKYSGDMTIAVVKRLWDEWERHCDAAIFYLEKRQGRPKESANQEPVNPYAAPTVSPLTDRLLLTYKGAYVLVWGMIFPVKQIRLWLAGRRTKRVLRRC